MEQNDGMQTPGVVARLMGLESMPVVCHDKPKKASGQGNKSANHFSSSEKHSKLSSGGCGYNLEKGSIIRLHVMCIKIFPIPLMGCIKLGPIDNIKICIKFALPYYGKCPIFILMSTMCNYLSAV